jgi:hypothetical protein
MRAAHNNADCGQCPLMVANVRCRELNASIQLLCEILQPGPLQVRLVVVFGSDQADGHAQ